MKSKKKVFLTVLCAAALVVASVLGTMAFLTSKDTVTNTFTVGKVNITLDEALVNDAGQPINNDTDKNVVGLDEAPRVKTNDYKLIPGHTYTKDPTIHVTADSENSWIFVKVENGLSAIEADTTIAKQITGKNWTALEDNAGVYYKEYTSATTDTDLKVFDNFKIENGAVVGDTAADYANKTIIVTGYAIQKDGFPTAAAAWAEVSKTSTRGN